MTPNNPLAFPNDIHESMNDKEYPHQGMTLRDYFANSADVKEVVDTLSFGKLEELTNVEAIPNNGIENIIFCFELEAKLKYMKADAMLKQSEL